MSDICKVALPAFVAFCVGHTVVDIGESVRNWVRR